MRYEDVRVGQRGTSELVARVRTNQHGEIVECSKPELMPNFARTLLQPNMWHDVYVYAPALAVR